MENAQISNLTLKRVSGKYHFETSNEQGVITTSDADPKIGGTNLGVRPMEMLLASLASCSTIDVILILGKQRQDLKHIEVDIAGTKVKRETYSEFTDIHMHFRLYGTIKPNKAERAIALSVEQYCSVAMMIKESTNITTSFDIFEPEILEKTKQ